jgi:outer membrane protein insertion porin family/translocation and assembly module TamA
MLDPAQSARAAIAKLAFLAAMALLHGCKTVPRGRSAVDEIQVRGASQLDDEDVIEKLATAESPKFLGLFQGVVYDYALFDRFVLQRDLARVEALYRSKGYYEVHARAGRVHPLDDKHVRVEILVEEGRPALVRSLHTDGLDGLPSSLTASANAAARERLPLGKPFVEEQFLNAEGNVRRALTDRGYAYAKVKSDAAVDIVRHAVEVVLTVTPGPRCTFGDVHIEGLGSLPEKNIRRTIDIKKGSFYSQKDLEDAQQALLDLGLFASVEVTPDIPSAPSSRAPPQEAQDQPVEGPVSPGMQGPALGGPSVVPVRVKLEPSRIHTLRLGGGVEFDALKTAVHGLVGWESHDFFGGLRTFSVRFRPGVVLYPLRVNDIVAPTKPLFEERLRADFRQPGLFEARTIGFLRPELNIYPVLLDPDPPEDARVIGYAELRNAIGLERTIWKFYGALSYDMQVAYPFGYVGGRDPTLGLVTIFYPELYTTFDFRDDPVHPRKGIFLGNSLQIAGKVFGGSANDVKVQPEVRGYVPLTRRVTLAARATVGLLEPKSYGYQVRARPSTFDPPSEAVTRDYQLTYFRGFFSGGPSSNRGYPLRGVGPYGVVPFLTPTTEAAKINAECGTECLSPTGGFTLWEASAELRISLSGPFSIATFCDASDVSPQTNDIRLSHPHLSCGGGARYDTPAGPIRLDVGYRIPGMQVIGGLTPDEKAPSTFVFGIPIALHIGIGEAY